MKQYYCYCLTAVLILIPLASISHFIPPLHVCLLADICNHTWIPECAQEFDYDYRLFIDECDVYEYNCDYKRNYTITNYSLCFAMCPPLPTCPDCPSCKACRMGNWVLRDGRKMFYDPIVTIPLHKSRRNHDHYGHEGHNHFVEHIHLRNGHRGYGLLKNNFGGIARKPDRTGGPHRDGKRYRINPGRRLREMTRYRKTPKKTKKPTKKKPVIKTTIRTTKQIIKTATMASMLYSSKLTVLRNGKMYQKVIKYYAPIQSGIKNLIYNNATIFQKNLDPTKDSDFLEK